MNEMKSLHNLSQYANFETFDYDGKTIILYDDHRCLLTALYEARKLGVIDKNTDLVTFDMHDDARPLNITQKESIRKITKEDIENVSQREFKTFVEFELDENDGDWVSAGMELGLINNIINVGSIDGDNICSWASKTYEDMTGKKHFGQVINHIAYEFSRKGGALGDIAQYEDFKTVHEVFGYKVLGEDNSAENRDANLVLDFDLDCFTTECQNVLFAWPEAIFRKLYGCDDNGARHFMLDIIRKAKFITICREPSYCGGIGESNKILGYIDKYIFNNCLGTSTIR